MFRDGHFLSTAQYDRGLDGMVDAIAEAEYTEESTKAFAIVPALGMSEGPLDNAYQR